MLSILGLPNQSQRDAEADLREQSSVLCIRDSPDLHTEDVSVATLIAHERASYLSQNARTQSRLLKELNREFSRDDTEVLVIGCLEQLPEDFLLVRR